jgi:hypothetical protein
LLYIIFLETEYLSLFQKTKRKYLVPADVPNAGFRQQPPESWLCPKPTPQAFALELSRPLQRKAQTDQPCQLKFTMSQKAKTGASLAILVFMLVMAPAVKADPIEIVTSASGFQLHGLGNNGKGVTNADFDSLIGGAHSASNTVDSFGGSFTTVLNPLLFTPGFTGFGSGGVYHFNFSQLLTVNGQTQTLNMLATLTVSAVQDTIRVTAGSPLIFQFDTFSVAATVLPVTMYGTENGQFRDFLCARFEVKPNCDPTVPEPATMVLLGTGLAGIAARVRKRRRAKAS